MIFLLFVASLSGILFWYFKTVEKSMMLLQQAQGLIKNTAPEEVAVKIFFGNEKMNPNATDCAAVFPVTRMVKNDLIVRRRAAEELLRGPTPEEIEQGYYSSIPNKEEIIEFREKVKKETGQTPYEGDEIKVNSLKATAGELLFIDFSKEMKAYGGGSCRVDAIKAQIGETMNQFPEVGHTIISIEGEPEKTSLQP
jgi:spore germination protein GerM